MKQIRVFSTAIGVPIVTLTLDNPKIRVEEGATVIRHKGNTVGVYAVKDYAVTVYDVKEEDVDGPVSN